MVTGLGQHRSSCLLQDLSPGQGRRLEREVRVLDTGLRRRGILDHVREVRHGVSESVLDRTKVGAHVRDILDRVIQTSSASSRPPRSLPTTQTPHTGLPSHLEGGVVRQRSCRRHCSRSIRSRYQSPNRDWTQIIRLQTYRRVVVRGRTGSVARIVEDPVRCRDLRDTDRDRHLTNTEDRLEHQGMVICRALPARWQRTPCDRHNGPRFMIRERGRHVARRITFRHCAHPRVQRSVESSGNQPELAPYHQGQSQLSRQTSESTHDRPQHQRHQTRYAVSESPCQPNDVRSPESPRSMSSRSAQRSTFSTPSPFRITLAPSCSAVTPVTPVFALIAVTVSPPWQT